MSNNKLKIYFLFIVFFLIGMQSGFAQCDPMFDPFCEDVDVPLDDWIPYLLLLTTAITVFFIQRSQKVKSI